MIILSFACMLMLVRNVENFARRSKFGTLIETYLPINMSSMQPAKIPATIPNLSKGQLVQVPSDELKYFLLSVHFSHKIPQ